MLPITVQVDDFQGGVKSNREHLNKYGEAIRELQQATQELQSEVVNNNGQVPVRAVTQNNDGTFVVVIAIVQSISPIPPAS